jgi:hypothetical protein
MFEGFSLSVTFATEESLATVNFVGVFWSLLVRKLTLGLMPIMTDFSLIRPLTESSSKQFCAHWYLT